jgi:hypothetical protein
MFIQVVRGKVTDADAMRAAGEKWNDEIRPGAKGFLGSTGGVADDGTAVIVTRWESEEAAQANSDRPEQGQWFSEHASKAFDGAPTFYNCPEVDLGHGGGSDDAGFVQIMIYKPKDLAPVKQMAQKMQNMDMPRKDVLGSVTGYATDGTVIDAIYFTNEAEAREGEKMEMPAEFQEMMKDWDEANVGEVTYIDLRNPEYR